MSENKVSETTMEASVQFSANGHKRAILYARVSTDEQAEKGFSLPSQLEACRKYAEQNGFVIAAEIPDDFSGTKLDRPGLDQARAMLEQGQADAIIVLASDRLTRNLAHLLILREEWKRAGVELHFVNRGKSEDTPEHRMTENVEGVFNEYWRERLIEASKRARNSKAKSNRMILPPNTPFGYARKDGQLVICEDEASTVRLIFNWYLHGYGEDGLVGIYKITNKLNELGIPNPKPKLGHGIDRWHKNTVKGVLANELYIGKAYYGKTRMVDGKSVNQPHELWIPIDVPDLAIIDRKTFEAVQAKVEKNKAEAQRNRKHDYLLAGHLTCGACGAPLVGHTHKDGKAIVVRYQCQGFSWRGERCSQKRKSASVKVCDPLVWNWILELFKDPENVRRKLTDVAERGEAEIEAQLKQMQIITDLIVKAERKIQRLASIIAETEDTDENETALDALKHQMRLASKEQTALKKDFDRLESETFRVLIRREDVDNFTRRAAALYQKLLDADFNEKRQWLDRLNFHAVLKHDGKLNRYLYVSCELGVDALAIDEGADIAVESRLPFQTFRRQV
jgi:site-specific DNA recombinase